MGDESNDRVIGAERPPIVEEGHRHEKVPEEDALHAHQREYARERARLVVRREIDALVPEYALHYGAPTIRVKVRESGGEPSEGVPLVRRSGEALDACDQSTTLTVPDLVATDFGSLRHCATLRKRNSPSNRSSSGRVLRNPE